MTAGPLNHEREPRAGEGNEPPPREESPRLDRLFEAGCDWLTAQARSEHVAIHAPDGALTYHELDGLANQLARYLLDQGARPGDRIGLLLDQGADIYIAMLAVLKIQAVYIMLDLGFPPARLARLATEAGMHVLISETSLAERLHVDEGLEVQVVLVDLEAANIGRRDCSRLDDLGHAEPVDDLASLIYPTGPTPRPSGVEMTHTGMCNFALTAAKMSGLTLEDRVYEGLSAGTEFSAEGIWVAWVVGATMISKGAGPSPRGPSLRRFLAANRVTALYGTPALLASLDEDLPALRFIVLTGGPCPSDLLARWRRPGRRVVSIYGTTPSAPPVVTLPLAATARAHDKRDPALPPSTDGVTAVTAEDPHAR